MRLLTSVPNQNKQCDMDTLVGQPTLTKDLESLVSMAESSQRRLESCVETLKEAARALEALDRALEAEAPSGSSAPGAT